MFLSFYHKTHLTDGQKGLGNTVRCITCIRTVIYLLLKSYPKHAIDRDMADSTGAVLDRIFIFVVSSPSIYGRCLFRCNN